jgi:MFS family permease
VADLTLTARRWYLIGLSAAALTLFLLGVFPLNTNTTAMLVAIVFVSQVASTFIVLPVGGLMAHTVAEEAKGRAAGWYQAGNLGGTGIGRGAGVWLASQGDCRRVPIAGNAGRRVGAILRVRRTPGYNGNNQATAALVRPRHLLHVALADSAVHHRFGDVADWRQRDE